MSLASKLADVKVTDLPRRGPVGECEGVYGPGTLEDWQAVEDLRLRTSWRAAQEHVDHALDVPEDRRIVNDKFRYHWRRKCYCWPRELRR